ncbi:ketoacyl-ACP synthase III [Amycolatopsis sp.]|uniref:3-oxoacyl-ACP synthase III family protein n=1 Tax=Amycolatopsis sp. TaxID=37632 RepID=UPI002BAD32E9|nr:ketoacyl-ACP synthase III [Amycolatopsis sp.]HVV11372.1 ketoacyl-ACP synthase III [Amycolatopsis sp.]
MSAGILGTGSYLPKQEITNSDIENLVEGATAEWVGRKTEIRARRYAAADEATSDLAAKAAEAALDDAGLVAAEIDYLIVSTSTGDHPQPPTSNLVQNLLGATNAACLDINVVCSGFVYGLELARGLLALRPGVRVLVVAADLYSRILDFGDRRTAVLLGDGAGAAVVGEVAAPYGVLATELVGRGDAHRLIRVDAGGSRVPATHETIDEGGHFFRMDGRGVSEFVMENVPGVLARLAERAGHTLGEIGHFVPHQANGVLLRTLVERCGLGTARTHRTLERYGNVGSASVPVALDDARRAGAFADGDLVLLAGFGGGMSVGATLLRWGVAA